MMPTMNYPYPPVVPAAGVSSRGSRMPGARGPWWARVLISAAITVLLWGLSLVILIVTDHSLSTHWSSYIGWTLIYLIFVVTVGLWGRTAARCVLGALIAFILLALSHGLDVLFYVSGTTFHVSFSYDTIATISAALFLTATIGGWSIARRATPFAWIGVIPMVGVVGIGTWVLNNHMPSVAFSWFDDHSYYPTWWWFANVSIQAAFVIAGVLVVWACDAIGLALRRDRPTPTSAGPTAAWGTQGGPAPWPPSSPATSGPPSWPAGQQPVWPSQPPPAWPTPPPQAWPGQPPSQPPAGT